jgi:hypothetical protein
MVQLFSLWLGCNFGIGLQLKAIKSKKIKTHGKENSRIWSEQQQSIY